jgi:3-deoxy-7-phosphoheptulonate synthase
MIVVMEAGATDPAIESVIAFLVSAGFDVHRSSGTTRTTLGVVGDVTENDTAVVRELDGVAQVVRVTEPFRLASRRFRQRGTVVEGPWGTIGGERPWIAIEPVGPGTRRPEASRPAEDDEHDDAPPHSAELPYAVAAGRPFDATVTRSHLAPDVIGSLACLSMHPQPSAQRFPVRFIARPPSSGANAWIGAAERELERAECQVVLLESGGEYPSGARTLEVAAIARAKQRTHLPIVVDVPTIAERRRYVAPVACAAVAAGADGIILRVWVGKPGEIARVPATLAWDDAVDLAERVRATAAAVRQ